MHRFLLILSLSLVGPLVPAALFATSVTPMTTSQRASEAGAIFRATTESVRPFRGKDGFIHTRATFSVHEVFKGRVPSRVTVTYRGGVLGNQAETVSLLPELIPGQERLLFLSRHADGRLIPVGGPAGVQLINEIGSQARSLSNSGILNEIRRRFPQAVPGADLREFEATEAKFSSFSQTESFTQTFTTPVSSSGAIPANALLSPPRRYTITDRGEPIRYVIDDEALPPGVSFKEAVQAVENALAAWSEVSSLTFERIGYAYFGKAADKVNFGDETLAIQLHNLDGEIAQTSTLGLGGQASTTGLFPDGGAGGRVEAIEFNRTQRGYVILNHTAPAMQNLATLEEVLCHEIGHALGLAHSSESPSESNTLRREAIMYYAAEGEGRGATLGVWDIDAIDFAYPTDSQPPYSFDRVLRVVSSPKPLANPEVNQLELRGFSAQNLPLTVELYYPVETNGSFSLTGSNLSYTADAFLQAPEANLATGYYDYVFVRFNDGVNLSPPMQVRIVQFLADQTPAAAPDGLPDSWSETHFGSTSPTAGLSRAQDDPDKDGRTNLREFQLGSDPLAFERFAVTAMTPESITFPARPYDVYELQHSSDLITWESTGKAVRPTTTTGEIPLPASEQDRQFFRVERIN